MFYYTYHISQAYRRWPLCISWCLFISDLRMNVLLHTSQAYGRWPLCITWCIVISVFLRKVLLHASQANGCWPECSCWCASVSYCWSISLLHTAQAYRWSSAHTCWCSFWGLCKKKIINEIKNKINKYEIHENLSVRNIVTPHGKRNECFLPIKYCKGPTKTYLHKGLDSINNVTCYIAFYCIYMVAHEN